MLFKKIISAFAVIKKIKRNYTTIESEVFNELRYISVEINSLKNDNYNLNILNGILDEIVKLYLKYPSILVEELSNYKDFISKSYNLIKDNPTLFIEIELLYTEINGFTTILSSLNNRLLEFKEKHKRDLEKSLRASKNNTYEYISDENINVVNHSNRKKETKL